MIEPSQAKQEMLDPENRQTLFLFLKKRNPGISEDIFDLVNRMAPLRVLEKVSDKESPVDDGGRNFLKKMAATNNGAKPGEDFEDFLWRYIESDDVPAVSENEFQGLADVYEKISGLGQEEQSFAFPEKQERDLLKKERTEMAVQGKEEIEFKKSLRGAKDDSAVDELKSPIGHKAKAKAQGEALNKLDSFKEQDLLAEAKNKQNKMDIKKSIQDAQADLVKELAIDQLPPEEQERQLIQIADVLQQRILLRIVEDFPEEKKEQLLSLTEDGNTTQERFQSFVEENLPNVDELVLDEVGQYKKEMLEFAEGVLDGGE